MQNNVFLRLAQERYTTKHYNGQQIPREEFDTLLEILRLTPTSVNAQALHYFTATSQEARERLLSAFPEFNRDRIIQPRPHYRCERCGGLYRTQDADGGASAPRTG